MATNDCGDGLKVIDGSILEGGGQILRNAVAFCCLLRQNLKVEKIRAGRSNPGLRAQHLTGIQLVCDICKGRLDGGCVKSTEIMFQPGQVKAGNFLADTQTAGSVCLLMQAALPCMLMGNGPCNLTLKGGTNADMAPPIDYTVMGHQNPDLCGKGMMGNGPCNLTLKGGTNADMALPIDYTVMVFKPMAEYFGVKFDCNIARRGFYPKGGGEVFVTVYPVKQLSPVTLMDPGKVTKIYGKSFVAGVLPVRIHLKPFQQKYSGQSVEIFVYPVKQLSPVTPMDLGKYMGNPPWLEYCLLDKTVVPSRSDGSGKIYGKSFVAGVLPVRIASEMAQSCERMIRQDFPDVEVKIEVIKEQNAVGNGTGIIVCAVTDKGCIFGGSAIGKRGVPAESVGKEAGEMLLNQLCHGGCMDDFLQDQLIILMALANGKSSIRCGPVTLHTETAIHVAHQLTSAKFTVNKISAGQTVIECEGIGLTNSSL